MERETREFEIDYALDWEYGVPLSKIKQDIAELEKLGATNVDIDSYISCGESYVSIHAMCVRLETDEEFVQRISEKNRESELEKQRELEQLAKLKAKYESNL